MTGRSSPPRPGRQAARVSNGCVEVPRRADRPGLTRQPARVDARVSRADRICRGALPRWRCRVSQSESRGGPTASEPARVKVPRRADRQRSRPLQSASEPARVKVPRRADRHRGGSVAQAPARQPASTVPLARVRVPRRADRHCGGSVARAGPVSPPEVPRRADRHRGGSVAQAPARQPARTVPLARVRVPRRADRPAR